MYCGSLSSKEIWCARSGRWLAAWMVRRCLFPHQGTCFPITERTCDPECGRAVAAEMITVRDRYFPIPAAWPKRHRNFVIPTNLNIDRSARLPRAVIAGEVRRPRLVGLGKDADADLRRHDGLIPVAGGLYLGRKIGGTWTELVADSSLYPISDGVDGE